MRFSRLTVLVAAVVATGAGSVVWADDDDSKHTSDISTSSSSDESAGQGMLEEAGEDVDEAAGRASEEADQSIGKIEQMEPAGIRDEIIGVKPQLGIVTLENVTGDTESRLAVGATLDFNVASSLGEVFEKGDWKNVYIGPSTGFIYSRTGVPDATLLTLPMNLKVGYNIMDNFRISAHGGGNITYRSVQAALVFEDTPSANTDGDWELFPNLGADLEVGIGRSLAVMFRPDVTFTPGNDFFTGTLALSIPFGNPPSS